MHHRTDGDGGSGPAGFTYVWRYAGTSDKDGRGDGCDPAGGHLRAYGDAPAFRYAQANDDATANGYAHVNPHAIAAPAPTTDASVA